MRLPSVCVCMSEKEKVWVCVLVMIKRVNAMWGEDKNH